jgi:hypothetical protein
MRAGLLSCKFPACSLLSHVQVSVISFLFLLLIVLVIGTMPLWPYSRTWGFYPSGLIALTMSVILLLAISGRL